MCMLYSCNMHDACITKSILNLCMLYETCIYVYMLHAYACVRMLDETCMYVCMYINIYSSMHDRELMLIHNFIQQLHSFAVNSYIVFDIIDLALNA